MLPVVRSMCDCLSRFMSLDAIRARSSELYTHLMPADVPISNKRVYQSLPSILDPDLSTLNTLRNQSAAQLASNLKDKKIHICALYHAGASEHVDQIAERFESFGLALQKKERTVRNVRAVNEFINQVIEQGDYTICVISDIT